MNSKPAPSGKNEGQGGETFIDETKSRREQAEALQNALGSNREDRELVEDHARIGSIVYDHKADTVEYSGGFYKLLGIEPRPIWERPGVFHDLYHPDDRERIIKAYSGQFMTWPPQIEYRIVRPDGAIRYLHSETNTIYDGFGDPYKTVTVIRDITENRRMEESFRESEARYRELVENSNSIFLRLDKIGRVTFINEFAQRFFDYAGGELIGEDVIGTIVPASDSSGKDLMAMMGEILQHPEDYRTNINENMRKGGEPVWVSWTNKAIYDDKGEMVGLLCIGNDITRLKQAEKALEESKMQSELYLDLMGHDINNMHQIALGYLEMAREMIDADKSQMEYLDKPVEVLQRSARLISNVRKMQKLRDGLYRTRTMDVCEVLADVHREYGATPHKPVKLECNGIARCLVRANDLLYDVFANLVINAIKYTGDRADILISLELAEDEKSYCRISVADDGPGVPDDFKNVIFHRMLKGTAKAKGMGMGLYLVKSLVDSYGGRVWVEDRIKGDHEKGARFVVMLPTV